MSSDRKPHRWGLGLAIGLPLLWLAASFFVIHGVAGQNIWGYLAGDLARFNARLFSPLVLVGVLAGLYVLPRLPALIDGLVRRLKVVKVGDLQLELAPQQGGEGVGLDGAGPIQWVSGGALWAIPAPAHQGALRAGAPPEPTEAYRKFPDELRAILAALATTEGAEGASDTRTQVERTLRDRHEEIWERMDRAEAGWADEWEDHLVRSADALEQAAPPGGLRAGLGRSLLFRRMMILDLLMHDTAEPNPKRRLDAASKLVESLGKVGNDVRAGFLERDSVTTLLLILLGVRNEGSKPALRRLGELSESHWVDGELRSYQSGNTEVALAVDECIKHIDGKLAVDDVLPAQVRPPDSLWALRVALRIYPAPGRSESAGPQPRLVAHALALLRATSSNTRVPMGQLRHLAARILCQHWPYGECGVDGLLVEVPEISADPAMLNDLARAVVNGRGSERAVHQAQALLSAAQILATGKPTLEALIARNTKRLAER